MEESKIIIIDDQNVEHEMTILFTFEDEATHRKFVAYFDTEDEKGNVYASIYDDQNNLTPITDDKDWEMVEEVLDSFIQEVSGEMSEEDEDDECGCGHHHHHHHDDEEDEDEEEEHECCCGDDEECECEEHEHKHDHECKCKEEKK
jgi:uncharacterized protein YrzB (UPF0473 family)